MGKNAEYFINEVESDIRNFRWEHQRANKFIEALKIYEGMGDNLKAQKMEFEVYLFYLRFSDIKNNQKNWKRFAPMWEYNNGSVFPDPNSIPDEALDYYEKRAEETKNPIHKARYCDIIWEKRKKHLFARNAIDAYLECVPIYLENDWQSEMADCFQRSAELALSLNDDELIKQVKERILGTMGILVDNKKLRFCLELIDALKEMKEKANVIDFEKAINISLKCVKYYKNEVKDGFHIERDFLEEIIDLYRILGDQDNALIFQYKVAESYEREAKWKLHNYPNGNSVAASFYTDALNEYIRLGRSKNSEKINGLKIKIKEHNKKAMESEFKVFSVPIKIPSNAIGKYLNMFDELSIQGSLEYLAKDSNLLPNIEDLRDQIEKERVELPLSYILPRSSLRNANVVVQSTTDEEIFEDLLIQRIDMHCKQNYMLLGKVFDYLKTQKGLDTKSLADYLSHSDIFEKENLEIILVGIDRYFEKDYVSAIHVLIPQIEAVLRRILLKVGLSTTKSKNEDIIHEKTLYTVLNDLKSKLNGNFWYYLKTFLVDQRGENLRNDVAHGLLEINRCTKGITEVLIHQLILLTEYGEIETGND
ncbi:MAG: DUF4209 domain-containing protein [Thermotogota bacterium]|nr:DUF4209 domain-containing protein [Thermotogota bacterium]